MPRSAYRVIAWEPSIISKVSFFFIFAIMVGVETLAFTPDGWISRFVDNYMSLTVHYVTSKFVNRQYVLNVRYFSTSHNLRILFEEL